jgi:hypothetical protein
MLLAMRSALLVAALVPFAATGCQRDERAPPAPIVVEASATAAPATATASSAIDAGPTDAGPIDAGPTDAGSADAGLDTSKWEKRDLNALGTGRFAFDGTIMFPKGTKTRASGAVTSGGGSAGMFAFLELPDRTEVMLSERSATSVKDGSFEKQLVGQTMGGKLVFDRSDANGFFFAYETRDGGVVVQGASWTVSPGIGCGTRNPITKDKVAVVDAICASLRPKTPAPKK